MIEFSKTFSRKIFMENKNKSEGRIVECFVRFEVKKPEQKKALIKMFKSYKHAVKEVLLIKK